MGSSSSFPTPFGSACLHGGPQGNATKGQLMCVKTVDYRGRTIASWQDVSLQQGIADLSLPLAHSSLGSYTIEVEQKTHIFYVESNRPPHFQVLLQLPSFVTVTDEMIPLHVCGWYPSGKPFRGRAEARLCQWHNYFLNKPDRCATFEAEVRAEDGECGW